MSRATIIEEIHEEYYTEIYDNLIECIKLQKPQQIKNLKIKDIKQAYEKLEKDDINIIKIKTKYLHDTNYILKYNDDYYIININNKNIVKWSMISLLFL